MTKMLLAFGVLLFICSIGVAQAQTDLSSKVVVGQTAEGKNVIVSVIPLKFMDPELAVQLMSALGFGGNGVTIPTRTGADYEGARRSGGSRSRGGDNYQNSQTGYGGYGQASQQSQQYPGYQSPYGNR